MYFPTDNRFWGPWMVTDLSTRRVQGTEFVCLCTVILSMPWWALGSYVLSALAHHHHHRCPQITLSSGCGSVSWLVLYNFIKTGDLSRSQSLLVQALAFCLDPSRLSLPSLRPFHLKFQGPLWKWTAATVPTWHSRTTACFLEPPFTLS